MSNEKLAGHLLGIFKYNQPLNKKKHKSIIKKRIFQTQKNKLLNKNSIKSKTNLCQVDSEHKTPQIGNSRIRNL
jgi:hypothetical protein